MIVFKVNLNKFKVPIMNSINVSGGDTVGDREGEPVFSCLYVTIVLHEGTSSCTVGRDRECVQ